MIVSPKKSVASDTYSLTESDMSVHAYAYALNTHTLYSLSISVFISLIITITTVMSGKGQLRMQRRSTATIFVNLTCFFFKPKAMLTEEAVLFVYLFTFSTLLSYCVACTFETFVNDF